ncbi:MAG: prepilin-type N-terminal cleavage/methylation domain-containing protein [Acidobacteria bacterium]|nr:prepilin-type N-terminal cleavage/methylation domain-containing protein [Acidobacteriota bacterium]
MRIKPNAGLTLLEVLVAVSLLSLLSVAILTALRTGAMAWEKTNTNLMLDRRIASANAIFHAELEGIFPAWAQARPAGPNAPSTFLFFQGQPESMRFVTSYSLEAGPRAGLRLVELQVTPAERGKRVLLNELPFESPRAAGRVVTGVLNDGPEGRPRLVFAPILAQPTSFVIADELEGCTFFYLTEDSLNERARFVPVWTRIDRLPAAVSVQLIPRRDSARLRAVSVVVPIRSTMLSP